MKDKLLNFVSERVEVGYKKNEKKFFFLSTIQAPELDEDAGDQRQPIDVSCVIDRSGSMQGDRMKLTKETLKFLVQELKDKDRIGIVLFDTYIETFVPLTYCTENSKNMIISKIEKIDTRGSTNLSGGLASGMEMLRSRTTKNPVSSCLLFTDGEANQGYRDLNSIMKMLKGELPSDESSSASSNYFSGFGYRSRKKKKNPMQMKQQIIAPPVEVESVKKIGHNYLEDGVAIYTFGAGHNEELLKGIADSTHGIYYFIETIEDISESFVDCLGGLMSVVMKDIAIELTPLNGVKINKVHTIYRLSTGEDGSYTVHLPDLQSEEKRDILFEAELPALINPLEKWEAVSVNVTFQNKEDKKCKDECFGVLIRSEKESEEQDVNEVLDEQKNRVLASEILEKARELADQNKFEEAQKYVEEGSTKIQNSKSGKSEFCKAIYKDMQEQSTKFNRSAYYGGGRKKMVCQSMGLRKQRVADVSSASNQLFQNKKRRNMKKKYKSKY